PWSDPLQLALGQFVELMGKVTSLDAMRMWLEINTAPELDPFTPEQVWQALERRRSGDGAAAPIDLRAEEWQAFQAEPASIDARAEFKSRSVDVPHGLGRHIARVVLLERLREVRALRGFTRIDAIPDIGALEDIEAIEGALSPIFRAKSNWYP